VTQPILFAVEGGEHSPVTEGATNGDARNHEDEFVRGDLAELMFCVEARKRGYWVKWMQGNCKGYDVILERDGMRPMFVQVKHLFRQKHKGCHQYKVPNTAGRSRVYSLTAYDVLACYLWDRDQWVFYMRKELGARCATSYMPAEYRRRRQRSHALSHRQPDNWDLIEEVAASLAP
jgi:hypothetical protein